MAEIREPASATGGPDAPVNVDMEVRDIMAQLPSEMGMQQHDIVLETIRTRAVNRARAKHARPMDALAARVGDAVTAAVCRIPARQVSPPKRPPVMSVLATALTYRPTGVKNRSDHALVSSGGMRSGSGRAAATAPECCCPGQLASRV